MHFKKIIIKNYRRFREETIILDKEITTIAGSNNSGKTSLIDLFKSIFVNSKENKFSNNIPVELSKLWIDEAYDNFLNSFQDYSIPEDRISDIFNNIFCSIKDETLDDNIIPSTSVKIQIDYNADGSDDIRNFADYFFDFDQGSSSIFFEYIVSPNAVSFRTVLEESYNKLEKKINNISSTENPEQKEIHIKILKDNIFSIYIQSLEEKYYWTNDDFSLKNTVEPDKFKKLFNFNNIYAGRQLDDQNGSNIKGLSKRLIELANYDDKWVSLIEELPETILQSINITNIQNIIRDTSSEGLSSAMEEVSKVNGAKSGKMILDSEITEDHVRLLLNNIVTAKFSLDEHVLNESSQGLGYSNMLYILLQLETYKKSLDPFKLNFFIIEEPESHMHPQMQTVFAKYLSKYYNEQNLQGIITTHSSEIVRTSDMKTLRVIRPYNSYNSKIYDFSIFKDSLSQDPVLSNFYDWFYEIGFSEIVFADRVILSEGDTERLMIRKLASYDEYNELNKLYIAFIQVGGAYAFNYHKLLEFLEIKALILTDIDYCNNVTTPEEMLESKSSNSTLNKFYRLSMDKEDTINPTVSELFEWIALEKNLISSKQINVLFQNNAASCARTLEEAMLSKKLGLSVFETKSREDWKAIRDTAGLKFSIPNNIDSLSIKDIVKSTSKQKTDFMYSVILNDLLIEMLPEYIESGLKWLLS